MSEAISPQNEPYDRGSEEVKKPDEADPTVDDFHAKNRQRKKDVYRDLRNLRNGAAIGVGKVIAESFLKWLTES